MCPNKEYVTNIVVPTKCAFSVELRKLVSILSMNIGEECWCKFSASDHSDICCWSFPINFKVISRNKLSHLYKIFSIYRLIFYCLMAFSRFLILFHEECLGINLQRQLPLKLHLLQHSAIF